MKLIPYKVEIDILPKEIRGLLFPLAMEAEETQGCSILQIYSTGYARGMYFPPNDAKKLQKFLKPFWEKAREIANP